MSSTVSSALRTASVLKALRKALQVSTLGLGLAVSAHAAGDYAEFESGHVRPLAMSADGTQLFAVNTPNGTLDIFNINGTSLTLVTRVPVGLEPVAVALRNGEAWVVNHLSDSVSVISLNGTPRVTRTLLVGDEPRDIVFAGSPERAFVTTAHRGQQLEAAVTAKVPGAKPTGLTTPGLGRADVWVFDAANPGNSLGGNPVQIVNLFSDTPRGLAVSTDKKTVYVAAHFSGNQTAAINEEVVCDGFEAAKTCTIKGVTYPGGAIGPSKNVEGKKAPEVGLIVKYNPKNDAWEDIKGRNWNKAVLFRLPDKDVFAIDANTYADKGIFSGVGTTLFNMAVNPRTGALYVTNIESQNMGNFEGDGAAAGGMRLQGNLAHARVTVLANGQVTPRHLNKHLSYDKLVNEPGFDTTAKNHSLALPLDVQVTADGNTMYVSAYGSNKIGVFSTASIENNTFDPRVASANYIKLSGKGGPSGMVLDEKRGQMYVITRFDDSVSVINMASKSEVSKTPLQNPEPAHILEGRPFLYDAFNSSANGENSCASCHIFGDYDKMTWNLGNPGDKVFKSIVPGKFTDGVQFQGAKLIFGPKTPINGSGLAYDVHPMKGPMATQTLRGLNNQGAQHWRGDRNKGIYGESATSSLVSFKNFAVAFEGLLGNPAPLNEADMTKFANYQLSVMMPPNPIRNLDNSLTAQQQRGHDFYFGARPADGFKLNIFGASISDNNNCDGCHTVDAAKGFFGTGQMISFEGITQIFKVPQLRNLYTKAGRFGAPAIPFSSKPGTGEMGDQVTSFGFVHDGTADTLAHFFTVRVFAPTLNSGFPLLNPDKTREDVSEYVHAIDSDLAPIVGQQITLNSQNASEVGSRVDLLIKQAKKAFVSKELGGNVTECDLVASVVEGGTRKGYLLDIASGNFVDANGGTKSDAALRSLANVAGQEVTYTCTVPGTGRRIAFNV
ncbi:MAG: hypothetical protein RI907_3100, partial [Pseudomonadota bacterium]